MNIAAFIGARYYRSRTGGQFVSLISLVSFIGMVLGVIALVVVVSVMNGFDRELKQRILGAVPHVVIAHESVSDVQGLLRAEGLSNADIVAVTPFSDQQALLVSAGRTQFITIYGVDPTLESRASTIGLSMVSGELANLGPNEIVLGQVTAGRLGIGSGDAVNLVLPRLSAGGETLAPRLVSARLGGTFSLGSELDFQIAVMNLDANPEIFLESSVRVTLQDIFQAPNVARKLARLDKPVSDWTQNYGDFFRTVKMEKVMMFILLSFVVAIASFSIVSGLTMLVESKRRDIAVLQTMGLSSFNVMMVFLYQGIGIGLTGVLTGLALGIPLAVFIPDIMSFVEAQVGFSIVEGTYFDQIPSDLRWFDILMIALVAFLISVSATLYPAYRAAGLQPAAVLRYE